MFTDAFDNELNIGDYVYSAKSSYICYGLVIALTSVNQYQAQASVICFMGSVRKRTHWSWWNREGFSALVRIEDHIVPEDVKLALQKRAKKEWRKNDPKNSLA